MGDRSAETELLLKEFYIPNYIIDASAETEACSITPECPVLVFVNSRSGGQLGGDLLKTYRQLLNGSQVPFPRLSYPARRRFSYIILGTKQMLLQLCS